MANVSVCLLGEEKLDFDMRDDFVQVSLLISFQQKQIDTTSRIKS